jgi:hypothetical protein
MVSVKSANRSEKKLRIITGTIRSGTAKALTEFIDSKSKASTIPEVKVNMYKFKDELCARMAL